MKILALVVMAMLIISPVYADKISNYTEKSTPATNDYVLIVDTSTGTSKKAQLGNLPGGRWIAGNVGINTTSNVGIGSTNPGVALDVNGTVRATAFSGDGSALTGVSTGWTKTGTNIYNTTLTDNVGVGTSTATAPLTIKSDGTVDYFQVQSVSGIATGNIFVIRDSGNVGIGTATPGARFGAVGIGTVTSSSKVFVLRDNSSPQNEILSVEDRGKFTIGPTYLNSTQQGLNIIGKLAVGNTFLDAASQVQIFNSGLNTSSSEKGIQLSVTQSGSGSVTGISGTATQAGTSTLTGTNFTVTKSGAGSASDIRGFVTTPQYTAGSGTQTNMFGFNAGGAISAGGTVTNAYGFYSSGPTFSGTATNYYGGYFQAAGGGATNNYGLWTEGKTVLAGTSGNVGIGSFAPGQKLEILNGNMQIATGSIYLTTGQIYVGNNQGVNLTGTTSCTCTRYQAGICTAGTCI